MLGKLMDGRERRKGEEQLTEGNARSCTNSRMKIPYS